MSYRQIRNYENLQKRMFEGEGEYGIPQLAPTQFAEDCDWISFNYASGCASKSGKGVHFFVDDYQFSRLWTHIEKYVNMLRQFRYVMTPDFSTYTDFPMAIQIYNHFRKHWVGAYLQEAGAEVIPSISWSTPDSFEWCFDGEPTGGTVAVSSVGCMNSKERKKLFMEGYREMVKRLAPEKILFYGTVPEECNENEDGTEIITIRSFQTDLEARCRDRKEVV